MSPPFDLQRFVAAQHAVYRQACAELAAGDKRSHWMWFVFPQLQGLGRSAMSQRYGVASRAEAAAYLQHAVLGPRLKECTGLVLGVRERSIAQIFGTIDALKFRSSMTLFEAVDAGESLFARALQRCGGHDPRTLELLRALEAGR